MKSRQVSEHRRLSVILRAALVLALIAAVWSVYRTLPRGGVPLGEEQPSATALRILLRPPPDASAPKVSVQLYPINMTAARSEYDSEKRPGIRFEDFATRLMGDRQPVTAELNERGEAVIAVTPGRWWLHATLAAEPELTWRLPVNASGPEKTVELTPQNAYTRAKRF